MAYIYAQGICTAKQERSQSEEVKENNRKAAEKLRRLINGNIPEVEINISYQVKAKK